MEETQHQNPDISDYNRFFTCDICVEKLPLERKFEGCSFHPYCTGCAVKHIEARVIDHNISEITCPHTNCNVKLDPSSCQSVLPRRVFEKWCRALCESVVLLDASKGGLAYGRSYCPYRNCSELILNECVGNSPGSKITASNCPSCKQLFCFQCMVPWEEKHLCISSGEIVIDIKDDNLFMMIAKQERWRRCPSCHYYVERKAGCQRISCRCKTVFCYNCGSTSCICNKGQNRNEEQNLNEEENRNEEENINEGQQRWFERIYHWILRILWGFAILLFGLLFFSGIPEFYITRGLASGCWDLKTNPFNLDCSKTN